MIPSVPLAFPRAAIVGTGSYLPQKKLTNWDLQQMVATSDEWIVTRSGIRERRIAEAHETTSVMATEAARQALAAAGARPEYLDLIILATITPDKRFPATACYVQAALGATNATAYDINGACSGFLFGLRAANAEIRAGSANRVLVIGAEKLSGIVDYTKRETCVLFGDGAGAAYLERTDADKGIIAVDTYTDGRLADMLRCDFGGTIEMNGKETFVHAVKKLYGAAEAMLLKCGDECAGKQVRWCIPHQANQRITLAAQEKFAKSDIPHAKDMTVYSNIAYRGNTSAASIPIALDECRRQGHITPDDYVLLAAFGAGATWASALVKF